MQYILLIRIMKKGDKSVEAGRENYTTWVTHPA